MALAKPSWLRILLDRLNWDIFTWKVYIGDAVERGIDWALDWINWAIDIGNKAAAKATSVWDSFVSLLHNVQATFNQEFARVWARVTTWASDLANWWSARAQDVRDWISAARDFALDRIADLRRILDSVDTWADTFRRTVLPKLLDTSWLRQAFGASFSSIMDWWRARLPQVDERVETGVKPVRDEVNKHTTWLDLLKKLLTSPEEWLLDLFESMLKRLL
jgi:hypothetical protein